MTTNSTTDAPCGQAYRENHPIGSGSQASDFAERVRLNQRVVAKPAPTTPLTTLKFGELCARILPAGIVNVIVDQNGPRDRPHQPP